MKYRVTHETVYRYAIPILRCYNIVHLMPRDTPRQSVLSSRIEVDPTPALFQRKTDFFGNTVGFFTLESGTQEIRVKAVDEVEVQPAPFYEPANSPPWEDVRDRFKHNRSKELLDAYQYVFPSPYVPVLPELREFGEVSFWPGRPIIEAALDLTARVFNEFRFDNSRTTVSTPVQQVLRDRVGVCQDFTHLQIGAIRSLGLPARYVSGYILNRPPEGQEKMRGADASHAWLSIYEPGFGWIDLDPTNNKVPSEEHVIVAVGRDFDDVSPIKGITFGGGSHAVDVEVDVRPV